MATIQVIDPTSPVASAWLRRAGYNPDLVTKIERRGRGVLVTKRDGTSTFHWQVQWQDSDVEALHPWPWLK